MSCFRTFALPLSLLIALAACGGDATPPPKVATKPIAPVEAPVDTTAVPEPPSLILFARVAKPDAAVKTVGGWANFPVPGAALLAQSITDPEVADVIDFSQPVDAAAALSGAKRDPHPVVAISVAVKSFDEAKTKLSAKYKATPGTNGETLLVGIGAAAAASPKNKGPREEDEDDDSSSTCVLAHAPTGGRLVCSGDRSALELLSPFLSRTMPRKQWPADVHMEITLAALKEPLSQLKGMLPVLARSLLGSSSPGAGKVIEASVNELVDIVNDTSRMTFDAQLADAGLDATMKIDYASTNSLFAKVATSHPERADAPPPAFLHLPAETDLALYGRGSDPALFDHMRELLGNLALEVTEGAQMPEQERKAVRELVVDRMLSLFTGGLVYGKGFDAAALDKAIAARSAAKPGDLAARDETDRVIAEQMVGWHLAQVNEPITKVGPILKDWSALWNKAEFTKWAKATTSSKMLAQMHTGAMPAGVTLPKDSVHLEIVIPRPDIEEVAAPAVPGRTGAPPTKPAPTAKGKKFPVKPLVLHVLAVPDAGGTWIGFGMDGKLLAQKAAASLSTAPDTNTLGKTPTADALRDTKANGAVLLTVKGFLVFSALDRGRNSPYGVLNLLPNKGQTPIVLTAAAQPAAGAVASSISRFRVPSGAVADIVQASIKTR